MQKTPGWQASKLRQALPKPPPMPMKWEHLAIKLNAEFERIIQAYRAELINNAARSKMLKRFR